MRYLKQNTDSYVTVGPFIDVTDGKTLEDSFTVTNISYVIAIETQSGSSTHSAGTLSATASNDWGAAALGHGGLYIIKIPDSDLNFVGSAKVVLWDADECLPVWEEFMVVPANIWDSMMGTDLQDVNIAQWLGTACHTATTNGIPVVHLHNASGGVDAPTNFEDMAITDTTGIVKADLTTVNAHSIAGTGTQVADGFEEFFNVATPTLNVAATGSTLSAIPWNAAWDAEVQSECQDAIVANNLDHLMKTPVSDITKLGDGGGNEVPDSTVLSLLLCSGTDTDTYDHTTDSLESIRNKLPTNLEDMAVTDTTGLVSIVANQDVNVAQWNGTNVHAPGTAGVPLVDIHDQSTALIDAILDEVVEGTLTLRQILRILLSALGGKSDGGGTANITFRDNGDTKNRIAATVDASGNRTAVSLDAS